MQIYKPNKVSQERVVEFTRNCQNLMNSNWNLRESFLQIDRAYMRETDLTEEAYLAKKALRQGDADKFRNITMPVIMPQVEAAVTYQQSVFLTGYPIFSCVSVPEFADQASQLDTVIGEQQTYANWVPELLMSIRDGFKYNLQAVEVSWEKEVTYTLDTDVTYKGGLEGKPTETIWEGNKIKRMDLYNTFWDTRVAPSEVAQYGEFAGYNQLKSRIALKKYLATLPNRMNVKEAFESGFQAPVSTMGSAGSTGYFYPQLNPEASFDISAMNSMNWASWWGDKNSDGSQIKYKDMYQVTVLYGRILPDDFGFTGVPGQKTAQVWKFIIVNNQVVVYAEQLSNAHDLIPIFFASPLDDGLAYQTKSFAKNVEPIQEITTALSNSTIAARRRAISDRVIYDPSRISPAAINNDSPNAKIPVRPSAYQKPLSEAVYAFPFRDDQFQINTSEIQFYGSYANVISGLNPARQGQFVKGNKTKSEFDTVMNNANGRDQTVALTLEGNFFGPIKQVIKLNILQYQGGVDLINREAGTVTVIDPVMLRKANLVMKMSDGLNPSDKLIDSDTLSTSLQFLAQNQQIGAEYNVGDIFAYIMSSRGVKLGAFKKDPKQVAYENAVGQWQNAIQTIAATFSKMENGAQLMQDAISKMPQPTPEQFGYVPGAPKLTPGAATTPDSPTVLSGMSQVIQSYSQSQAQQPGQPQAAATQGQEG